MLREPSALALSHRIRELDAIAGCGAYSINLRRWALNQRLDAQSGLGLLMEGHVMVPRMGRVIHCKLIIYPSSGSALSAKIRSYFGQMFSSSSGSGARA